MTIRFNTVQIAFTGEKTQQEKKKEAEKKVVTGGGAVAATTTAARAKATKSGFDMFSSAKRVSQGMKNVTETTKAITNVTQKSTSLWSRVCENACWAKNAVLNWGAKFKNLKYIKPIITSKPFAMFAGVLGYGFGLITLISGCSDIVKVTTDTINENIK